MNRQFSCKDIKTIKKHMKKFSKYLIIREMHIKTNLRYHLTPSRIAKISAGESDECWRRCGKIGTLMYCWWSCELIQPSWIAIWTVCLWTSHTTAGFIPQRDNKEKDLYKNIYSPALCGGKIKWKMRGMPFNWGMAEQIVVSVSDGILLCWEE